MSAPPPAADSATIASASPLAKARTVGSLVGTAVTTSAKHYTVGPQAPTWTLKTTLLTSVARKNAAIDVASRQKNPPRTTEDVLRLAREARSMMDKRLSIEADELKDGIVKTVHIDVRKRELGGLLADLSVCEDGERKIKVLTLPATSLQCSDTSTCLQAEWLAHTSLLDGTRPLRDLVILSFHGGGHVRGSPATHRDMHVRISEATGCLILSVDYRLSPEVVFPASLLDAVHAFFYLTEDLKIPSSQVIVEGDSAGGHLALQLLMYLREARLPWDENREADYLALDDRNDPFGSVRQYLIASDSALEQYYQQLLDEPYVSPSLAPLAALASLPPLLVQAGGLECFRDEITVLVRRLRLAGNTQVTHQVWMDGVHVFQMFQAKRAGEAALKKLGDWVKTTAERDARLARVGHLAKSKDVKRHKYSWVQSTQRLPDVKVKPEGAHVAGKLAAADANGVADELAETEVFRPVRM
ncbi:Alpha/Beta hydrolase fold [Rhodotorula toruloides]|uniref:Alpha/Beta hydrolase fold n=1 Tax=Rhodotorula toruloides TaxID=5286 RepID=A0A2T0AI28_RHOTO|nr:Alpha/Beta hydrolase fold [Rhodotorula toruloides]